VTFGEHEGSDVAARKVVVDGTGSLRADHADGKRAARLPLLGRFNVTNALGVAACAWGMACRSRPSSSGSPPRRRCPADGAHRRAAVHHPARLLPQAGRAGARARERATPHPGRIILVFGAGGDRDRGKRAPMGRSPCGSPTWRSSRRTTRAPRTRAHPRRGRERMQAKPITAAAIAARRSPWRSSSPGRATPSYSREGSRDLPDRRDGKAAVRRAGDRAGAGAE